MIQLRTVLLIVLLIGVQYSVACAQNGNKPGSTASATPLPTPSNSITQTDIAKLKWIEGTWKGMDGSNPFYERYRLEGTALVVDGFKDGTLKEIESTGRFELKDGVFGKQEGGVGSAASSITDNAIQFVPTVAGKGNYFRFERQSNGTWKAILEWPATADKPARSKEYVMEAYTAPK